MTVLRFADGQVITIEESTSRFAFSAVLPPGHVGPPAHRHRFETETFTVEDGRLQMRIGRHRYELAQGQSLVVPPGTTHAFANPFDEPARIRTVESPAGPLQPLLRAQAGAVGRPSLLHLAEINAAHHWSFTLAGMPDPAQRMLWRLLTTIARARR